MTVKTQVPIRQLVSVIYSTLCAINAQWQEKKLEPDFFKLPIALEDLVADVGALDPHVVGLLSGTDWPVRNQVRREGRFRSVHRGHVSGSRNERRAGHILDGQPQHHGSWRLADDLGCSGVRGRP